jgi:serine/threonine protein kinase
MSNRYEIRDQIGKGGLGAVYKAFDTQLQREVAIKRVLSSERATPEEVAESARKLIAEAQTLSSLNHPNIITVFDVGQDEKGGYVVMELLKGETLDETVERGVLTQEDFTEVVYQTLEALIAAQANNVIHRDIKPTNIMVIWQASGKFQLKILDFGLAKFSKSPSVQTMDQEESVLGSIFFMAPEQFERGELDARTDLYQMGCVYYNALTGQYPFNGDTAPQVMNAHLQHKVVPLEQIRPDLAPVICQWVMWLINRDIDHRPANAREALKLWPRNPGAPGAIPVALPVEEVPQVSSSQVRIVTSAGQASAPPSLIVSGAVTGRLVSGSTTGRLSGTPGRAGSGANQGGAAANRAGSTASRPATAAKSGATGGLPARRAVKETGGAKKSILIGSMSVIVVLFASIVAVKKSSAKKREAQIIALSSEEHPEGGAKIAYMALDFLNNPDTSLSLRGDAAKVLERLDGPGVNEALLEALASASAAKTKVRIAQILADRGHTPAVPALMSAFRSATRDDERLAFLTSVRALADGSHVEEMLKALATDYSPPVRGVFEDTVLSVLRRSDNPAPVAEKILTRVATTTGNERKSLFRILGVLGGSDVKTRLAVVYKQNSDPAYQRDAIGAYLAWQDRSVLPEVEEIINTTTDKPLQNAAEQAYARLATLPGPESPEELSVIWRKAFQLVKNPNEIAKMVRRLIDFPSPATVAVLKEWENHPTQGGLAKSAGVTLAKFMSSLPALGPGESLKGNKGRIQGDARAGIDSFLESITGWVSPETWLAWSFKAKESGTFGIEIDQATLHTESSEFVVYLSGSTLKGNSKTTDSLETFSPVRLEGTVELKKDEVYTLILAPGRKIQPRMMDVGAVRLVKQ